MIRAFFFTCGLFTSLCGGALLGIDRVVLTEQAGRALEEQIGPVAASDPPSPASPWRLVSNVRVSEGPGEERRVIDPPDWAAFALLSAGGVTVLYALALPGRRDEEDGEE